MLEVQTTLSYEGLEPTYYRYCLRCRIRYRTAQDTYTCPVCERTAVIDLMDKAPATSAWRLEKQLTLTGDSRRPHHA